MKKYLAIALAAVVLVAALAACGNNAGTGSTGSTGSTSTPSQSSETTTNLSGVVNTDGSTSMADVMAVFQEVFKEKYPSVTVN